MRLIITGVASTAIRPEPTNGAVCSGPTMISVVPVRPGVIRATVGLIGAGEGMREKPAGSFRESCHNPPGSVLSPCLEVLRPVSACQHGRPAFRKRHEMLEYRSSSEEARDATIRPGNQRMFRSSAHGFAERDSPGG